MPKLTLNVEALEVQSFTTTAEADRAAGTVEGYDSGRTPGMTRNYSCPTFCPSPDSCADTCAYTCDTCDPSCNQCFSDLGSCPCQITEGDTCYCY